MSRSGAAYPCPLPQCQKQLSLQTRHSGQCGTHGWVLWHQCRGCEKIAVCEDGEVWFCGAHRYYGALCPVCWSLGTRDGGDPWRCVGGHVYYVARQKCSECRKGRLVACPDAKEWTCQACERKAPITR